MNKSCFFNAFFSKEKSIDVLIGTDYFFNFVTGKTKRGPPGCPMPLEVNSDGF